MERFSVARTTLPNFLKMIDIPAKIGSIAMDDWALSASKGKDMLRDLYLLFQDEQQRTTGIDDLKKANIECHP